MAGFTVPDGIRPTELDRFLDLLISNGNMDQALRQTDGDALELRKFARQAGYPSRQPMRDARTALREFYPEIAGRAVQVAQEPAPREATTSPAFQPAPTGGSSTARAVTAAPALVTPAQPSSTDDPVPHAAILQEAVASVARAADDSGSKSIAAAGQRFVKAHDALVQSLRAHADESAKAERIAALQAELARLRGKPVAPASAPAPAGHAKQVRAWAAEQSIDCPARGRVPQDVERAYAAAHEESTA